MGETSVNRPCCTFGDVWLLPALRGRPKADKWSFSNPHLTLFPSEALDEYSDLGIPFHLLPHPCLPPACLLTHPSRPCSAAHSGPGTDSVACCLLSDNTQGLKSRQKPHPVHHRVMHDQTCPLRQRPFDLNLLLWFHNDTEFLPHLALIPFLVTAILLQQGFPQTNLMTLFYLLFLPSCPGFFLLHQIVFAVVFQLTLSDALMVFSPLIFYLLVPLQGSACVLFLLSLF